jgi:hypothetical protein
MKIWKMYEPSMQIQLEANSKEQQSFEQFDCNHHQSPVKPKKKVLY